MGSAELDVDGTLFQQATVPGSFYDAIVTRRLDGLTEGVYSEESEPEPWVLMHGSSLVTGP